jgi:Tfp pilus assembly protein PilX
LRSEAGVALVMALLTVVVLLLVGAGLVTAAMTEVFTAQVAEDSGRALNVAEAGLAHAIQVLRQDPNWLDDQGATAGCDGGSPFGPDWKVLRNLGNDENSCMSQVPYPHGAAIPVSLPSPTPGQQAECASVPVEVGSGGGGSGPGPAAIGTYTVYFNVNSVNGDRSVNTLRVRVVGKVGRAQRGVEVVLRRVTVADFVAYSSSTVDSTTQSGSGTFTVHGSVYIRGDWAFKGNSKQLNDQPVSTDDAASPPYENQTYVCGDLKPQGNADIGTSQQPMKAVHVAGDLRPQGNAQIFANRIDKAVPDIRLPSVPRAVKCILGQVDSTVTPPINQTNCDREFPRLWRSYTNHLIGGDARWVQKSGSSYLVGNVPSPLAIDGSTKEFGLPRRGRESQCQAALTAANRTKRSILQDCAAWYDGAGNLYVAGGQVVYLPGQLKVSRDVRYRVDDFSPSAPDDPDAASTQGDASLFVVAGGSASCVDDRNASLAVESQVLAWRAAWQGATSSFPRQDLLAFLVKGCAYLSFPGNNAEVDGVFIVGDDVGRCNDPNVRGGQPGDLVTRYRLRLYGAVIAKCLKLQDNPPNAYNVDWYQVPDLRDYVVSSILGGFLNYSAGSAIIIQQWREIGF